MSSVLTLPLKPPFSLHHFTIHKPCSTFATLHSPSSLSFFTTRIHASSAPDFDREESRWLREEQRWLREEQRWLREEQRWFRDRESLLREISDLRLKIEALEHQISCLGQGVAPASDTIANIAALVQVLKEKNRIAETGSSATPMVLEEIKDEEEEEVVVVKEVVRVSEGEGKKKKTKKERRTLRKGAEGDEVQEMQEALQKMGFYSGEEDMEFSSFSSGTERAVKTWQSTLDVPEDGVMTAELLERLFMDQLSEGAIPNLSAEQKESPIIQQKESTNGTAFASVTEIEQKVVQNDDVTEFEASEHRVFLLGENRWEDSSRLAGGKNHVSKISATRCLTCRGEGRLMCTECDGTGEPNIEQQFLEWVDEEMKCPYCGGNGYTICDVCDGKTII